MPQSPTITIHITDLPTGGVLVSTSAATPLRGVRLTPAQALATDLLATCGHRASDVRYWQAKDPAYALVQRLLSPEDFGHAVTAEVRDAAREVLGLQCVEHHRQEA